MLTQKQTTIPSTAGFRRCLRAVVFLAICGASSLAMAQTHVYGAYWSWPNLFKDAGAFSWYPSAGSSDPTWTIDFNVPSGQLYGYPATIRGWHYGYNPSGDTLFPKQMSSIHTIPAAFTYGSYQVKGGTNLRGDFTYDMFLRNDNAKSSPELEVMVWGGNASYPISATGSPVAYSVVKSDGYTWDLYYGYNSAAGYATYSFVPHRTTVPTELPSSGNINVDLRLFFNVLKNGKYAYYSESMYLDVVEAGCEITQGDGNVGNYYFTVSAS